MSAVPGFSLLPGSRPTSFPYPSSTDGLPSRARPLNPAEPVEARHGVCRTGSEEVEDTALDCRAWLAEQPKGTEYWKGDIMIPPSLPSASPPPRSMGEWPELISQIGHQGATASFRLRLPYSIGGTYGQKEGRDGGHHDEADGDGVEGSGSTMGSLRRESGKSPRNH